MRRTHVSPTSTRLALIAAAFAAAAACNARQATTAAPAVIRLVDEIKKETIAGGGAPHRDIPRTEWRFDQPVKDKWDAAAGVTGLAVKDGKLSGRASTTFPVIHVQRTSGLDNQDIVHAIEFRMRVSAGSKLAVVNAAEEKINTDELVKGGDGFWMKTDIKPGTEMQTVTLTPSMHITGQAVRHLIVKPTDQSGASFDIESVRIVFRKEHLATIASG